VLRGIHGGGGRRARTAPAIAAVVLFTACGGPSASLQAPSGSWNVGSGPIAVGTRFDVGYNGFPVDGQGALHVVAARVLGVPDGLRVDELYAVSFAEMARVHCRVTLGASVDPIFTRSCPLLTHHPVRDAILFPGHRIDWYFIGVFHATRPGNFQTGGFQVDYLTPDGQQLSQAYRFTVDIAAQT
jgi:hypothetical protein